MSKALEAIESTIVNHFLRHLEEKADAADRRMDYDTLIPAVRSYLAENRIVEYWLRSGLEEGQMEAFLAFHLAPLKDLTYNQAVNLLTDRKILREIEDHRLFFLTLSHLPHDHYTEQEVRDRYHRLRCALIPLLKRASYASLVEVTLAEARAQMERYLSPTP